MSLRHETGALEALFVTCNAIVLLLYIAAWYVAIDVKDATETRLVVFALLTRSETST